jgi:hypothetical protein
LDYWDLGDEQSEATEIGLTRTIILLVLGCFLVVGAAAASILSRNSVPVVQAEAALPAAAVAKGPMTNRENKKDKLAVAALASADPQQIFPSAGDPMRQAFASEGPADVAAPDLAAPVVIPSQKPKLAAKPDAKSPVQKNYALLSDAQIAAIKGRLNLSAGQEAYWPAVEDALRKVAKKIHEQRQAKPGAGGPPIDPDSAEVQQLKSAAMPLLFQLREDQKREVRALARVIGLDAVASAI